MALLTGETVEVVDVRLGPHDHLERGYRFRAGGAAPRGAEQPQVVPLAQYQIRLGEQIRADLAEPAAAAAALQAVLVPIRVQCLSSSSKPTQSSPSNSERPRHHLQEVPVSDRQRAARAQVLLLVLQRLVGREEVLPVRPDEVVVVHRQLHCLHATKQNTLNSKRHNCTLFTLRETVTERANA